MYRSDPWCRIHPFGFREGQRSLGERKTCGPHPSKVEAQDAESAEEIMAVRVQHQTEVFLVKQGTLSATASCQNPMEISQETCMITRGGEGLWI